MLGHGALLSDIGVPRPYAGSVLSCLSVPQSRSYSKIGRNLLSCSNRDFVLLCQVLVPLYLSWCLYSESWCRYVGSFVLAATVRGPLVRRPFLSVRRPSVRRPSGSYTVGSYTVGS